ncbi:MAG: hypothetical protein PHG97_03595 [Candidatus Margulisbacteria bacterium]|nr:hypothetical protein [Candidatus Margulisiibacteriota bacterium]
MAKKVLIITDHTRSTWIERAGRRRAEELDYTLLALGFNGAVLPRLDPEKYRTVARFKVLDVASFAEASQEKIREFVPALVYKLPRRPLDGDRTLLRLFNLGDFNLWWLLNISEKSLLVNAMITRLYYIELIRQALAGGDFQELWLDLADKTVEACLIGNGGRVPRLTVIDGTRERKSRGHFWPRLVSGLIGPLAAGLLRYLILKLIGLGEGKAAAGTKNRLVFFSFFPYFWSSASKRGAVEIFYQSLPEQLDQYFASSYSVWLNYGPLGLWRQRDRIKTIFRQKNVFALERYLTPGAFLSLFCLSWAVAFKIAAYRRGFMKRIKEDYEGYDITNIVVEELNESILSSEMFTSLALMKAAAGLVKKEKIETLVYRIEFQPFEKALIYGLGRACRTVAFQHQAFARNHLQYFYDQGEIAGYYSDRSNPDNLPLPDKYFVTGEYQKEVLIGNGFPARDIGLCGPVRYSELLSYLKNKQPQAEVRGRYGFKTEQKIFLVLAPVIKEEVQNLMVNLLQVMNDRPDFAGYVFLIKFHPAFKFEKFVTDLIAKLFPALQYGILADGISLNDYVVLADAVMLTTTTIGIEAICLGVMPVLFENDLLFSLNPMLEIKNACLCVHNSAELEAAIETVVKGGAELKNIARNWPGAIRKMFYRINEDPNAGFKNCLEKLGCVN